MSEYIKQNFESGQILKAEHLNHMEDGITALSDKVSNLNGGNPDWSQNDETAPDYIKGRTHWTEIGEGLIEFNGDLTGQETFDNGAGAMFVKMSDRIFTKEELIGSTLAITILSDDFYQDFGLKRGKHEVTIDVDSFSDGTPGTHVIGAHNFMWAFIVYEEIPELPLSCGTWFVYAPDICYVNSISCLQGPMEVVHKLDPKYLPEGYPYVEVVKGDITFNGDLTGRETFPIDSDGWYFVKISEQYMTEQELIGQTVTRRADEVVESVIITEEDLHKEELDSDNYMIMVDDWVLIIKGDLSSMDVPFSEGTWFTGQEYEGHKYYIESLTGLTGDVEKIHQIDKKFIPEGVGMPVVTAEDNGKFLRVVDGQAAWVAIMNAEEATFGE